MSARLAPRPRAHPHLLHGHPHDGPPHARPRGVPKGGPGDGTGFVAIPACLAHCGITVRASPESASMIEAIAAKAPSVVGVETTIRPPVSAPVEPSARATLLSCFIPSGGSVTSAAPSAAPASDTSVSGTSRLADVEFART